MAGSLAERYAARQIRGDRDYQEDACGVLDLTEPVPGAAEHTFMVLADGMGGHSNGATAAKLAVNAAARAYRKVPGGTLERLRLAVAEANNALADAIAADEALRDIGCTLVCVAVAENRIAWSSVGDSPLWLLRDGALRRLNADHSMVPVFAKLVEEGVLSAEDARTDPKRHVLRSAVTGEAIKFVDIAKEPVALQPGDVLVLASDGVLSLADETIAQLVADNLSVDPRTTVELMLDAVSAAGARNQDNTTVMILKPLANGDA
ncbi:MAG: serine/threonine-protein phosphatase [Gammaproteobacteria bacterium]|nr:serine/threonine-protein phosphatase [Gammaproteobacteria bacterium]